MAKLTIEKIFKRALQGKGPAKPQQSPEDPISAVPAQSFHLQAIDDFIDKLEDYCGDYAHALMYGRDAPDDFLDATESDFDIDEDSTPLTEEELENLRFGEEFGDHLYEETPEEFDMEHYRNSFFSHLLKGAALMNATMSDICETFNRDYHTLWDQYMLNLGDLEDGDLVMIASQMHGELLAYKESLLNGRRLTHTQISEYIANKPLKLYKQDPEEAQPKQP